LEYKFDNGACVPIRVHTIVISAQHKPTVSLDQLRNDLKKHVVKEVIPGRLIDEDTLFYLNPCGSFLVGGKFFILNNSVFHKTTFLYSKIIYIYLGPKSDAGLTGRKIIVDTYGGWGQHGGGAFSGKDPTKVDRSAAYGARWVAKSLVKAGVCRRCLVQVGFLIRFHYMCNLDLICYWNSPAIVHFSVLIWYQCFGWTGTSRNRAPKL